MIIPRRLAKEGSAMTFHRSRHRRDMASFEVIQAEGRSVQAEAVSYTFVYSPRRFRTSGILWPRPILHVRRESFLIKEQRQIAQIWPMGSSTGITDLVCASKGLEQRSSSLSLSGISHSWDLVASSI